MTKKKVYDWRIFTDKNQIKNKVNVEVVAQLF